MLNGARADAGKSFPEADGVVVAGCAEDYGHDVGSDCICYSCMIDVSERSLFNIPTRVVGVK